MTSADLVRRIDAVLVLDEGRFEASRQIIGDVLRDCRDALTRENNHQMLVSVGFALGKSETQPAIHFCQLQNCPDCKTGVYAS